MIYQSGDYVYPADLPRPLLCRVDRAETVTVRDGRAQILRLEPLEGPWPQGTVLVRLDDCFHDLNVGSRQIDQSAGGR